MTRKVIITTTPEQRRTEAAALQASIAEQVQALRSSSAWEQFLDFSRAFHHYSVSNVLLILAQRPHASHVAGYRTWQALGRQVSKEERGIRILAGRQTAAGAPEHEGGNTAGGADERQDGEAGQGGAWRFFPVSVFDISQTQPRDPSAPDPFTLAHHLVSADPLGIAAAVREHLAYLGWTVSEEVLVGAVNGYTTTDGSRRVVIDATLSPAQAAKTCLHEAAHILLHTGDARTERADHRGIAETKAESVAYVVAGVCGLDTSAYSIGYVAGWSRCETALIKAAATRVLAAAHTLIEAITTTDPSATN